MVSVVELLCSDAVVLRSFGGVGTRGAPSKVEFVIAAIQNGRWCRYMSALELHSEMMDAGSREASRGRHIAITTNHKNLS